MIYVKSRVKLKESNTPIDAYWRFQTEQDLKYTLKHLLKQIKVHACSYILVSKNEYEDYMKDSGLCKNPNI